MCCVHRGQGLPLGLRMAALGPDEPLVVFVFCSDEDLERHVSVFSGVNCGPCGKVAPWGRGGACGGPEPVCEARFCAAPLSRARCR